MTRKVYSLRGIMAGDQRRATRDSHYQRINIIPTFHSKKSREGY